MEVSVSRPEQKYIVKTVQKQATVTQQSDTQPVK